MVGGGVEIGLESPRSAERKDRGREERVVTEAHRTRIKDFLFRRNMKQLSFVLAYSDVQKTFA